MATSVTSGVIYGLRKRVDEAVRLGQYTLEEPLGESGMGNSAGLVHRDIKPANIFFRRYGIRHDPVKVLNFSLVTLGAPLGGDEPKLTVEGAVGGTPAYQAP